MTTCLTHPPNTASATQDEDSGPASPPGFRSPRSSILRISPLHKAASLDSAATLINVKSHASSILRISPSHRMDSPDSAAAPDIQLASTWDSDSDESSSVCEREVDTNEKRPQTQRDEVLLDEAARLPFRQTPPPEKQDEQKKRLFSYDWLEAASFLYVAQFAAFGYLVRVFVSRFFGSDCAFDGKEVVEVAPPNDVFSNFFVNICVTNNGLTDQTGGALFIELPANMLGCFIMGMVTHPHFPDRPLPWVHPKHSLQKHKAFIDGLRTGFCGCLTTFASWNTQMVRMLDGTATVLGPQVVPALCGYVLGLSTAFSGFVMGRLAHEFLVSRHDNKTRRQGDADLADERTPPSSTPVGNEKEAVDEERGVVISPTESTSQDSVFSDKQPRSAASRIWRRSLALVFNVYSGPPLFLIGALSLCLVGAVYYDIRFYQEVFLAMCFAPIGALLRWKLADLNWREGPIPGLQFVPWGTLMANLSAALISVLVAAVQIRYLPGYDKSWTSLLLPAIKSGLAGSLSTVSTLIKEMFAIERPADALIYASGSLTLAMLLGLLVFSPIARGSEH